jgi:hypothetical protein
MNPHAIRHNFVTKAKREYQLDDMHIKRLIGHRDGSNVMETTYAHLSDEDVIKAAEEGAGLRQPEEESSLTPDVCHCGEPLAPDAKACPRCGTVYTPDAKQATDMMDERVREQKEEAETLEEYKDADAIAQALEDDPKLAAQLMQKLGELSDE